MKDFSKNLINGNENIIEALIKLNDVPLTLTLFVIDNNDSLIGTLTDGDVRRGFINGLTVDDEVSLFMSENFHAINESISVYDFKNATKLGIRLLPLLSHENKILKVFDLKNQKSILPIECMIMAGGRGDRLRPLTDNVPKPMLMIGKKPIIEHNIDRLIRYGIEKFYISVKYLGEQIVDYLGDGSNKGVEINYIWEDEPLGTAGALSIVEKFESQYILLMNSDIFTDIDFEDLYLNVIERQAEIGVATIPYTTKVPYGIFNIQNNRIISIQEKPTYTNYANAGIYVLNKNIIERIPKNKFYNITDLIENLIADNQLVIHNPIVGYWIDIGQHQDYINAQEIIKHLPNE